MAIIDHFQAELIYQKRDLIYLKIRKDKIHKILIREEHTIFKFKNNQVLDELNRL